MVILGLVNDGGSSYLSKLFKLAPLQVWQYCQSFLFLLPRAYIWIVFVVYSTVQCLYWLQYCARHDFSSARGWMQMVFYYHMIYSPEINRQSKTLHVITIINDITGQCTQCTQWYVLCA